MRILLVALLVLAANVALAQVTVPVLASWEAPTSGGPVDTYEVQVSENGGPFVSVATTEQLQVELDLTPWSTYVARVRGINPSGTGPWSAVSDPYMPDPGVPGAPQNLRISPPEK